MVRALILLATGWRWKEFLCRSSQTLIANPFLTSEIPLKSVCSNFLTTTAVGRYWIKLNHLELNLTVNPPPLWNFLGFWPPPPPHYSGISNSPRGGGMDIFWNHTFQVWSQSILKAYCKLFFTQLTTAFELHSESLFKFKNYFSTVFHKTCT